jgi:hypothetical protein
MKILDLAKITGSVLLVAITFLLGNSMRLGNTASAQQKLTLSEQETLQNSDDIAGNGLFDDLYSFNHIHDSGSSSSISSETTTARPRADTC